MRNLTVIRAVRAICGPLAGLSAGYLALHWLPLSAPDPQTGGLYCDSLFLRPWLLSLIKKPGAPYVLLALLSGSALAWWWSRESESDREERRFMEKDQ